MKGTSLNLFFRIIARNKELYLLKIISLSIAFATSLLVILFSFNEFRYDRFHAHADSIFRVLKRNTNEDHLGNRLSNKISSEVFDSLSFHAQDSLIVSRIVIMNGVSVFGPQRRIDQSKVHAADPAIVDIFTFKPVDGALDLFRRKDGALLSASFAETLFGTTQASGKVISLYSAADTVRFSVAGVYEDFPKNSHEEFNLIIPFGAASLDSLGFSTNATGVFGRTVLGNASQFEKALKSRLKVDDPLYLFQPLTEIYFGPRVLGEDASHGDRYSVVILLAIASLILFLAVTSYVNLTTLTLPHRAKELAIRKLAGTDPFDLFLVFLSESLGLVLISFCLGAILLIASAEFIRPILSIDIVALALNGDLQIIPVAFAILVLLVTAPLFLTFRFIRASPNRLLGTEQIHFHG